MRRRHYTWVFVVAARLVIDLSPVGAATLTPPTSPPPKSLPYIPPPPEDPPDDGEDEGGGELPEKGPGEPFWLWPSTSGPWPI
jgi:hypothetical protein